MQLTVKAIENAKPKDRPYRLAAGRGLALLVHPNGGKYWRQRFRRPSNGKATDVAFGTFPTVTLKEALAKSLEAHRLIGQGIDPAEHKKALKHSRASENSFEALAREFLIRQKSEWDPRHHSRQSSHLERHIFPWIGARPANEITPPELLRALQRMEAAGKLASASKVKSLCGQIFRYGVALGRCDRDPTNDLKGALAKARTKHFAAITDPAELGGLLQAIRAYHGEYVTRAALELTPLTFSRPGILRTMPWSELDLETALWSIPAARMKTNADHIVPLSKQAIEIFREIEPLTRHRSDYVFPGARSVHRPLSDAAVTNALRSMGYSGDQMTAHGFRATARTLLDEQLGWSVAVIEMQLAHVVRDPLGRAYNRTQYLDQRRDMMQQWADYLDSLRELK